MNVDDIRSVKYLTTDMVLVNDAISVPTTNLNRLWRDVQKWVAAGNSIAPADLPPAPEPREVDVLREVLTTELGVTPQKIEQARARLRAQMRA